MSSTTIGASADADYEPYKLKYIDEGIWQADGDNIKFCSIPYSIRMYVVQLSSTPSSPSISTSSSPSPSPSPKTRSNDTNNRASTVKQDFEKAEPEDEGATCSYDYWLFSPIQPEPKLIEQIKELVTSDKKGSSDNGHKPTIYIVYGNCLHHIYAEDWIFAFPDAKLCGPEELITKMKKDPTRQTLKFDYELNNKPKQHNSDSENTSDDVATAGQPPWYDEINYFLSDKECNGFIEEVVFYHQRSKSLIVTDLIQNHNVDSCPGYDKNKKFIYRCVGISKTTGGGIPIDYKCGFHFPFGNIQKARQTLQQALDWWDFDKILITHGDSIIENAREYYSSFINVKI